jgi:hypothetical protein
MPSATTAHFRWSLDIGNGPEEYGHGITELSPRLGGLASGDAMVDQYQDLCCCFEYLTSGIFFQLALLTAGTFYIAGEDFVSLHF